jgi:outer membrane lipase/esterase
MKRPAAAAVAVLIALLGAAFTAPGMAQTLPNTNGPTPPTSPVVLRNLPNIPGLTGYQAPMATTIDVVCPRLVGAGFANQNTPTGDLTRQCTGLILAPGSGPVDGIPSLGLDDAQTADALGKLTPEEVVALGPAGIEALRNQLRLVTERMAVLKFGLRGAGPRANIGGHKTVLDGGLWPDGRGGAASADLDLGGRLGIYLNATAAFGDKEQTQQAQGFDFWTAGVILGADWRFAENIIAGAAFTYAHTDSDVNYNLGDVTTNSYGIQLYSTMYFGNLYLDLYGGFNWNTYDTSRRIVYANVNRTARGDTDGQQYNANVGTGYDFVVGAWTFTPLARLEFTGLHIDSYNETGADGLNLRVATQKLYSLVSALGAQVGYAFSVPFGVLVPQVAAEWRHEWLNNGSIRAAYAFDPFNVFFSVPRDEPNRDYAAIRAGLNTVLRGGWQAFLNYEVLLGLRDISYNNFVAGVRKEF